MQDQRIIIGFDEPEGQKPPEKKAQTPMKKAIGLWVGDIGGNAPVAVFDESIAEAAKAFAENLWPENHIFASVLIPEHKLITRQGTKAIKQFGVNVLTKLLELSATEDDSQESSPAEIPEGAEVTSTSGAS